MNNTMYVGEVLSYIKENENKLSDITYDNEVVFDGGALLNQMLYYHGGMRFELPMWLHFDDVSRETFANHLKMLWAHWINENSFRYYKIKKALEKEYDPIANVDGTETRIVTESGSDSVATNTNTNTTTSNTISETSDNESTTSNTSANQSTTTNNGEINTTDSATTSSTDSGSDSVVIDKSMTNDTTQTTTASADDSDTYLPYEKNVTATTESGNETSTTSYGKKNNTTASGTNKATNSDTTVIDENGSNEVNVNSLINNDRTENGTAGVIGSENVSTTYGKTTTDTYTRMGNIGVTSSQQLELAELDLRTNYNLIDICVNDFLTTFAYR